MKVVVIAPTGLLGSKVVRQDHTSTVTRAIAAAPKRGATPSR